MQKAGLLSVEDFPEPSGLSQALWIPVVCTNRGHQPRTRLWRAALEDSRVWSWVSWAGQEQLLHFSESPSPRTGSAPGM